MLYIFLVNNGKMMTFDMNLAIETVETLKWAIFRRCNIPVEFQVLLISGGESLQPNDRVCQYSSAGTDTSPIFLFCKNEIESMDDSLDSQTCDDMKERVESCLQMEPNFNTVESRNEMAMQLYETDRMLFHSCENLVHDQHLQQQSWAAVLANLEDIVTSFETKAKNVEVLYADILKNKVSYIELLENFNQDKKILSKMPLLKCLISKSENLEEVSLLEWIIKKDSHNSLDEINCLEELEEYDEDRLSKIKINVASILTRSTNSDMKEIKGLEQRLSALEKLICEAKNIFEIQGILTKSFNQNKTRISDLRDVSILPDLCHNHKEQLQLMLKNHLELVELNQKCLSAKLELSQNLHKRLGWIIHVHEELKNVDDTLVLIGIKLQKLCKKLKIAKSLHLSPKIYLESITEVIRRRTFSKIFYQWADNISKIAKTIIEQEIKLRKSFTDNIDNHFLRCFFHGMNDLPQNFFNDPIIIDQSLPQITWNDVDYLRSILPEMSSYLVVPDPDPLGCLSQKSDEILDEISKQNSDRLSKGSLSSSYEQMSKIIAEKDKISEQFSKLIENMQENSKRKIQLLQNHRHSTLYSLNSIKSDYLQRFKSEIESNRVDFLFKTNELRYQLGEIQDYQKQYSNQNESIIEDYKKKISGLEYSLQNYQEELTDLKAQLIEEKRLNLEKTIANEHLEKKLRNFTAIIHDKSEKLYHKIKTVIMDLRAILHDLYCMVRPMSLNFASFFGYNIEVMLDRLADEISKKHQNDLEQSKLQISDRKDREIQKLREQLQQDHKNELETLRRRFKLAISTTSIERTGSESSLEKVQLDIVDQSAQETEIQKLKTIIEKQSNDFEQKISLIRTRYENDKKQLLNEFLRKKAINSENDINLNYLMQKNSIFESTLTKIEERLKGFINQSNDSEIKNSDQLIDTILNDIRDSNRKFDTLNTTSFISLSTTPEAI
ncbi:Synaptonemal complex protein 1-like protein [Sarcoptes scabiei]|uniref:RB1-inducible coiled-coil protein 1 n=1 Tax=Sarcoptes scabiei TaxID=52283 RepID=A0A132A5C2_SARSC|nr:Synaptonemal complex protein 1-like protein [Sarcoptes scabiei]